MSTDESLAKALGWTHSGGIVWESPDGPRLMVPNWSTSFDACLRDIVPVLRARGMYWRIDTMCNDMKTYVATVGLWSPLGSEWEALNVVPAAAFCEAALKALGASSD